MPASTRSKKDLGKDDIHQLMLPDSTRKKKTQNAKEELVQTRSQTDVEADEESDGTNEKLASDTKKAGKKAKKKSHDEEDPMEGPSGSKNNKGNRNDKTTKDKKNKGGENQSPVEIDSGDGSTPSARKKVSFLEDSGKRRHRTVPRILDSNVDVVELSDDTDAKPKKTNKTKEVEKAKSTRKSSRYRTPMVESEAEEETDPTIVGAIPLRDEKPTKKPKPKSEQKVKEEPTEDEETGLAKGSRFAVLGGERGFTEAEDDQLIELKARRPPLSTGKIAKAMRKKKGEIDERWTQILQDQEQPLDGNLGFTEKEDSQLIEWKLQGTPPSTEKIARKLKKTEEQIDQRWQQIRTDDTVAYEDRKRQPYKNLSKKERGKLKTRAEKAERSRSMSGGADDKEGEKKQRHGQSKAKREKASANQDESEEEEEEDAKSRRKSSRRAAPAEPETEDEEDTDDETSGESGESEKSDSADEDVDMAEGAEADSDPMDLDPSTSESDESDEESDDAASGQETDSAGEELTASRHVQNKRFNDVRYGDQWGDWVPRVIRKHGTLGTRKTALVRVGWKGAWFHTIRPRDAVEGIIKEVPGFKWDDDAYSMTSKKNRLGHDTDDNFKSKYKEGNIAGYSGIAFEGNTGKRTDVDRIHPNKNQRVGSNGRLPVTIIADFDWHNPDGSVTTTSETRTTANDRGPPPNDPRSVNEIIHDLAKLEGERFRERHAIEAARRPKQKSRVHKDPERISVQELRKRQSQAKNTGLTQEEMEQFVQRKIKEANKLFKQQLKDLTDANNKLQRENQILERKYGRKRAERQVTI